MAAWQVKNVNRKNISEKTQNLQKGTQNSKLSNGLLSSVPPINCQLAQLTPTKELLLHYHQRIAKYEDEWKEITTRLDHYSKLYNNEHILEKQIQTKNDEIIQLQRTLSNVQSSLFQEREHVLHLYAENDRLKLHELEDRRQIQHLLALCGKVNSNYKTSYMEEPRTNEIPERLLRGSCKDTDGKKSITTTVKTEYERNATSGETESLKFQIEALKVQLAEKEALFYVQIEALRNDCDITREEAEVQRLMDAEKIKHLTERLKEVNELVQHTTKDYINFRKSVCNAESAWTVEKVKLLEEIENIKMQLSKYKEKSDLMEELSSVKEELSNYDQQTLLIDEINLLKRDINNSISSLVEELRHVREQITSCFEQINLQKEMCTESSLAYNKRQDPLKRQLLEKSYRKLQQNLSSVMENIVNIEDQASMLCRTSTDEIVTVEQQIDHQGRIASIEKSLEKMRQLNGKKDREYGSKPRRHIASHSSESEMNHLAKASEIYQSKNLLLVEELNKLKETHNAALQFYKDRSQRLEKQLELKTSQQQELIRYHRLQVDGFKSDVKILKEKLVEIEKQLLKATLQLEHSHNDMALLKIVHATTVNAKEIANDLKSLKQKLYQLENDLKEI